MKYLETTYEQYQNFITFEKSERLSKNLKIFAKDLSKINIFSKTKINEIFDSEIKTKYNIHKDNYNNLSIYFKTNSNTEYRLDLIKYNEEDKGIVYHIGFSLWNVEINDYDVLTEKHEMIEILNRIKYIINDIIINNLLERNYFCIGADVLLKKKNDIYQYFLKIVLGKNKFKKLQTKLYDSNWGLYFELN